MITEINRHLPFRAHSADETGGGLGGANFSRTHELLTPETFTVDGMSFAFERPIDLEVLDLQGALGPNAVSWIQSIDDETYKMFVVNGGKLGPKDSIAGVSASTAFVFQQSGGQIDVVMPIPTIRGNGEHAYMTTFFGTLPDGRDYLHANQVIQRGETWVSVEMSYAGVRIKGTMADFVNRIGKTFQSLRDA